MLVFIYYYYLHIKNDDELSARNGRSIGFMPPWDEMSGVVFRCLPHRQIWVSNLSKFATHRLEVHIAIIRVLGKAVEILQLDITTMARTGCCYFLLLMSLSKPDGT